MVHKLDTRFPHRRDGTRLSGGYQFEITVSFINLFTNKNPRPLRNSARIVYMGQVIAYQEIIKKNSYSNPFILPISND